MAWTTPIYDRTIEDVILAEDNRDDAVNYYKGRMMPDPDWMRVTGNIHYLSDILTANGYDISAQCKTIWDNNDNGVDNTGAPLDSQIAKIDIDMMKIRNTPFVNPETPIMPDMPFTHFEKINAIEKILFDVLEVFTNIIFAPQFGNTFHGGNHLYLLRGNNLI